LFLAFRALECSGVNWTIIAAGAWRPPPDPTGVSLTAEVSEPVSAIEIDISPLCDVLPVVPPPELI